MSQFVAIALAFSVADHRPANPESLDVRIRALSPERRESSRLAAADWCERHAAERPLPVALPTLERTVRGDSSAAVRAKAVAAVGAITQAHDLPCPEVVFAAMLDGSANVRLYADIAVAKSGRLTPAGIAALARVADSNDPERRTTALFRLGYQSGKDPTAQVVIRHAMKDPSRWVRRAAYLAHYWTTRKFDEAVPYVFATHAASGGVDALPAWATQADRDEAVREETAAVSDFAVLGGMMRDSVGEAVPVLIRMTEDADPRVRLGAVMFLNWDNERDKFCSPPLRKRLAELATTDKDSDVRRYARKVLDQLSSEKKK